MEAFAPYASEPVATLPAALLSPQTVAPYRIATAGYATGPADDPAHTLWYPRIPGDLEISQSGVDALGIGGRLALGSTEIDVWDADEALAQMARYGTADGRAPVLGSVFRDRQTAGGGGQHQVGDPPGGGEGGLQGQYPAHRLGNQGRGAIKAGEHQRRQVVESPHR